MNLDRLIHEPARLRILAFLAGSERKHVSFNDLQNELGFTPGNLSVQLARLLEAKFITVKKSFKDNRPHTSVSLTARGLRALGEYLDEMERIIQSIRGHDQMREEE